MSCLLVRLKQPSFYTFNLWDRYIRHILPPIFFSFFDSSSMCSYTEPISSWIIASCSSVLWLFFPCIRQKSLWQCPILVILSLSVLSIFLWFLMLYPSQKAMPVTRRAAFHIVFFSSYYLPFFFKHLKHFCQCSAFLTSSVPTKSHTQVSWRYCECHMYLYCLN